MHQKVTTSIAADFLRALVAAVPYKIHTFLTDNGIHFTDPRSETWSPTEIKQLIANKKPFRAHAFEYACALNNIDHRLSARRLKMLKGLTPYEFIAKAWTNQPERFILNPLHEMPGLNT